MSLSFPSVSLGQNLMDREKSGPLGPPETSSEQHLPRLLPQESPVMPRKRRHPALQSLRLRIVIG